MKTKRQGLFAACAALAVGMPLLGASATAEAAEAPSCDDFTQNVRQLVKPTTGANLLTKWDKEALGAQQRYGFTQDLGVLTQVALDDGTGLGAVWRLYKSGDFVWATEGADTDGLVSEGYSAQGIDFYAATEDTTCLAAIYRFKRGNMHRMAVAKDSDALVAAGWSREQVAFYAEVPPETSAPEPEPEPEPKPEPVPVPVDAGDTKFSVAVVPDTQNESTSATDPRFPSRANWLVQNKQALDLRYAMQIGDLSNWGSLEPAQFDNISTDLKPLEAAMPWAAAIGNHDTAAVCAGGSACPGAIASRTVRDTRAYNAAFPVSRFPNVRGTFESGKIDNSYQTFEAGGVDWMVLSLELWPRTAAVNWAKSVVASHPDHNVLVVTHSYLEADGSISGSNGGYGATSPRYLFDNLIKVYPNVKMVLSGHVGQSAVRTDTGDSGNKIVSLLQAFHSSTNPVRIVEIDTAAGAVTSKVYAPLTDTDYPAYSTSTSGMEFVGQFRR